MNLYNKFLFFKYNYWHMFSHKPLCQRFGNDVIRIKNIFLCRSCSFLYLGLLTGFFIILSPIFFICLLSATCLLSLERFYKKFDRKVRDVLRFLLGLLMFNTLYYLINFNPIALYGLALIFIGRHFYYKKRQTRKQSECHDCYESKLSNICSGYIKQSPSIRIFEEALTKLAYKKRGVEYE